MNVINRTLKAAANFFHKKIFLFLSEGLEALLFPEFCLHCDALLANNEKQLCSACCQLVTFLNPVARCQRCFCTLVHIHSSHCTRCHKALLSLNKIDIRIARQLVVAACFDTLGPMQSVVHAFISGGKPYLAKSLAGYLILQLDELGWPLPDYITSLTDNYLIEKISGHNPSTLLALEVAKLLSIPYISLLSKQYVGVGQVKYKEKCNTLDVHGKKCLLIHTVLDNHVRSALELLVKKNIHVSTLALLRFDDN